MNLKSIKVPNDIHKAMRVAAAVDGIKLNQLIDSVMRQYLGDRGLLAVEPVAGRKNKISHRRTSSLRNPQPANSNAKPGASSVLVP